MSAAAGRAARFYVDPLPAAGGAVPPPIRAPDRPDAFVSADARLSGFGAVVVALQLAWRVERQAQRSDWRVGGCGSPGLAPFDARNLQLGLKHRFQVATAPCMHPLPRTACVGTGRPMRRRSRPWRWAARWRCTWKAALAEVRRLEALRSRYRPDSLVSRINAAARRAEPVAVDAETEALLDFGAHLHAASGGRFELTSGVLCPVWDFRKARLPEPATLQAALARVGWARMHWDGATSRCPSRAWRSTWAASPRSTRPTGPRADGRPWQLGVRDPRRPDGLLAGVALTQGALATSGDYVWSFEYSGRRYRHLLDATTGWPARGWRSVSVVAPVCTAAGALATLALLALLGGAGAPALLAAEPVSR